MKRTVLATFIALGLSATAMAQQAQRAPAPPGNDRTNIATFAETDKDGDGRVNREEGNAIHGFDFSRADTNDDKSLTRAEFDAAMAKSTARGDGEPEGLAGDRTEQVTFEQADKNKDGKISVDEGEDIDGFNFSAADADDDRVVSRTEFQTAMAGSRPRG
ncbi:MAG TPA: EF-hand domain-containing protein [Gammaproteobacteria bacterium]|nr:EF-hand domain-containing protein [Gammaproteobacteria bacterium]